MKPFTLPTKILRIIFHLLYQPFAWSYDLIAAVVSGGQWKNWTQAPLGYLEGNSILELGIGPGHLQVKLAHKGFQTTGIDQSPQMIRIAHRRMERQAPGKVNLIRAQAQNIPIKAQSFDSVVATFPSEYIASRDTVREIFRILNPSGLLVILLAVRFKPGTWHNRQLDRLYQVTGQKYESPTQFLRLEQLYTEEGFITGSVWHPAHGCDLLIFTMRKGKFY